MAEYNSLGYWQLAGNLADNRANRANSKFQQVLDLWSKRLETMQAQDWTLNKQMPAAQANAMELQGAGDKAGLERLMAQLEGERGLQTERLGASAKEGAADRSARAGEFNASLAAKGDAEPTDFWSALLNAAKGSGGMGMTPEGYFDPAQVGDVDKLRKAFAFGTGNDPAMMKQFNEFISQAGQDKAVVELTSQGVAKDEATRLVNKIRSNPVIGPLADAILAVFTTTQGGQNITAAKNWLNRWFPGKMGDKLWPNAGAPQQYGNIPQFGTGSPPSTPRPGTAGGSY